MQDDVLRQVEQFLYREARLLDSRQFRRWIDLLADDLRYWIPMRSNRYSAASKSISILDGSRYEEDDLSKESDQAFMDEDKGSLRRRVDRLDTGMAWAEDPPSRTRHLISNVEVEPGERESEVKVYSNFIMYRSRGETEEDFYVGSREDVLRNVDGSWQLASRKIVFEQNVLSAKNLSNFFYHTPSRPRGLYLGESLPYRSEHVTCHSDRREESEHVVVSSIRDTGFLVAALLGMTSCDNQANPTRNVTQNPVPRKKPRPGGIGTGLKFIAA